MRNDRVETEILGYRLHFRPLEVRTPDGLRVSAQDWSSQEHVAGHQC